MQTITGSLVDPTGGEVVSTSFQLQRRNNKFPLEVVAIGATDEGGDFSFQLPPGTYFFRFNQDALAFRVSATSGSATLFSLLEQP